MNEFKHLGEDQLGAYTYLRDEVCVEPEDHDFVSLLADDLELSLAQSTELHARLRTTAQILIEEVGAGGPMNAEEAAEKAVGKLAKAMDRIKELEALVAACTLVRLSKQSNGRESYVSKRLGAHAATMNDKSYAEIFTDAGWHDFPGLAEQLPQSPPPPYNQAQTCKTCWVMLSDNGLVVPPTACVTCFKDGVYTMWEDGGIRDD